MKKNLLALWQARNAREQKILMVWVACLMLALVYMGIVSPLRTRIDRLERNIPTLESQLFAMRAEPPQPLHPAAQSEGDLRSVLFRLISAQKKNIDVRSLTPSRVELRLPPLPATEVFSLIDSLRRDARASVAVLSIQNDSKENRVRVVLEMERTQ